MNKDLKTYTLAGFEPMTSKPTLALEKNLEHYCELQHFWSYVPMSNYRQVAESQNVEKLLKMSTFLTLS
jgi:hypothetical protein